MAKLSSILLVDDDEACNFLNKNLIRLIDKEIEVKTVLDGQSALDYIVMKPEGSRQLILLDLNLPLMDGFEFLDEFMKLPKEKRKNIAIFILTSSDNEKDRERTSRYEAVCGYALKPLTQQDLAGIMESCFQDEE